LPRVSLFLFFRRRAVLSSPFRCLGKYSSLVALWIGPLPPPPPTTRPAPLTRQMSPLLGTVKLASTCALFWVGFLFLFPRKYSIRGAVHHLSSVQRIRSDVTSSFFRALFCSGSFALLSRRSSGIYSRRTAALKLQQNACLMFLILFTLAHGRFSFWVPWVFPSLCFQIRPRLVFFLLKGYFSLSRSFSRSVFFLRALAL